MHIVIDAVMPVEGFQVEHINSKNFAFLNLNWRQIAPLNIWLCADPASSRLTPLSAATFEK